MCNIFLFVICCSFVKLVWFSDGNNNEINVHVLLKSIRVHSYFIYQYQIVCQIKKKNDAIKTHKIVACMLLNKNRVDDVRHCSIPKHRRYKEVNS